MKQAVAAGAGVSCASILGQHAVCSHIAVVLPESLGSASSAKDFLGALCFLDAVGSRVLCAFAAVEIIRRVL